MSQTGSDDLQSAIAIVGGGIIGMSVAWRLAQRGFRVTVFERSSIGGEASWAGAGMLSPGGEVEGPSPFASLAVESRRGYADFIRELQEVSGVAIDFQENGALELAYSPDEQLSLHARAMAQDALGIRSKPLDLADVAAFWPRVRMEGLVAARFYPGDAIVNPRDVTAALSVACKGAGALLRQNCLVPRIQVGADSVFVEGSGVDARPYQAVVIAAGAWSSQIEVSGIDPLPAAEPVKGHLIGYRQPTQTCQTILRHGHTYVLQRANGLLIVGASVEHVGFDRTIQPKIAEWLSTQAAFLMPHLGETTPSETWVGFRPASDDLHIGPWSSPRVYLAYGHYRNGILLAPVTAQRIADHISASWGMR